MKVEYIGGPWDGKIEVATSFYPLMNVARKSIPLAAEMQPREKAVQIETEPHHIYALAKRAGKLVYIYKGESNERV